MAEKTVSKQLIHIEKFFSLGNPGLQKAAKVFHELDQLEYDLGLLDADETTAAKTSWWPIFSVLGGHSPSKNDFIARYLNTPLHSNKHKFTIYQYTPQENTATLPGNALDADYRLPFYQISQEIEQIAPGEGSKLNAYLELITVNSEALKGKLLVDTPVLGTQQNTVVASLLTRRIIDLSDLVLVFTDLFDAEPELINETIDCIVKNQDSNKFVFVIDHSEISLDVLKIAEIKTTWQKRLNALGITTGEFVVLTEAYDLSVINRRISNIETDRSYRILQTLEHSIRDLEDKIIPEVDNAIVTWKDRTNMTTLIVLGFLITILLFGEITFGVLDLLLDPIIGPLFLLILIAVLLPMHLIISKVHAKLIINQLYKRQKELNISENLANLFEKGLTFWRMVLPIKTSIANSKKVRQRIKHLLDQSKDLVQSLNDQFSHYVNDSFDPYDLSNDVNETFHNKNN